METEKICFIGDLKKAIEDLPNDRFIMAQVVGNDGSAWNCEIDFLSVISKNSNVACIILSHKDLTSLKDIKKHDQLITIG